MKYIIFIGFVTIMYFMYKFAVAIAAEINDTVRDYRGSDFDLE